MYKLRPVVRCVCYSVVLLAMFLICIDKAKAESIVYDEVVFGPVVLSEYQGEKFLEVEDIAGTVWTHVFRNYQELKPQLDDAIKKKMPLAFYQQVGKIVAVSPYDSHDVHVYQMYDETKDYYALSFAVLDADIILRFRITKEENPLSYKVSDAYMRSFDTTATVYVVGDEIIAIERHLDGIQ